MTARTTRQVPDVELWRRCARLKYVVRHASKVDLLAGGAVQADGTMDRLIEMVYGLDAEGSRPHLPPEGVIKRPCAIAVLAPALATTLLEMRHVRSNTDGLLFILKMSV